MGPWSEEKQFTRAMALKSKADDTTLNEDMRAMYQHKLMTLARNETQYNQRVLKIFNKPKRKL